jgi:hypothetical protein
MERYSKIVEMLADLKVRTVLRTHTAGAGNAGGFYAR